LILIFILEILILIPKIVTEVRLHDGCLQYENMLSISVTNEGLYVLCFIIVFDLNVETSKEHRETYERYKKLVSTSLCCVCIVTKSDSHL